MPVKGRDVNQAEINARLRLLVTLVQSDPANWYALPPADRLAVAAVLGRVDWFQRCGCRTIAAARAKLGRTWWAAVQSLKS